MIVPPVAPSPAAVIDHYEELDRFYRALWGEHLHHGLWWSGRESPQVAVECAPETGYVISAPGMARRRAGWRSGLGRGSPRSP